MGCRAIADVSSALLLWSREANPAIGEYGPPTTLFQAGDVPDME